MKRPRPRARPGRPPSPPFLRQTMLIFTVALLARLVHVWQIRPSPFFDVLLGDAKAYDAWAQRIAGGDWIGNEVFYQAPLYPYFLGVIYALFGRDLLAVRLVQAVLGAGACVLLAHAGRRIFSDRVGLVAGLMLAVYAPAIFFDGLLQKATLDVFLTTVVIWLVSGLADSAATPRARWLWLGVAMGAMSLTRENALVFVVVLGAWALWRGGATVRDRARAVGYFAAGLALMLLPVAARNSMVSGGLYITTSQFGPNFYLGNNPYTDGTAASLRGGRGAAEYERDDAVELAEAATGRKLTPGEVSTYWTGRALAYIRAQPADWARLMGRKFALLWNRTEMLDTESQETYGDWSWPVRWGSAVGHFGLLVPLAGLGLIVTWPERRRLAVYYALTAAYAASVVLFFIYARYRYPLVPFLILFAAAGTVGIKAHLRGHGPRRLVMAAGAVTLLAVFTNWPALSADFMRAITDHNMGAELQTRGQLDRAIVHYQRALAAKADYAPAFNNLGTALVAKGDIDAAVPQYQRALAIDPRYANAHYNLANALLQQGNPDAAALHFRRSLESGPGSADVHNNLGIALAEGGHIDEAIAQFQSALRFDADSAKVRRNLAALFIERGQLAEAITELRAAATVTPADAQVHNDLGLALAADGHLEEATREFERALELEPGSTEAQRNLAAVRGQTPERARPVTK